MCIRDSTTIESIASETLENIEKIEGFDSDLAKEILDRSKTYLKEQDENNLKIINENIKDDKLLNLEGINNNILAELAKSKILTIDDFADLASFELIVLSISILFSFFYESIRENEGYAVTEDLPKSFYVLNSYVYGDNILILIKENNNQPRLYKLKKSLKLNKFLKKYKGLKNNGQDVMVKRNNSKSEDSLGMYIESVQKKLPLK